MATIAVQKRTIPLDSQERKRKTVSLLFSAAGFAFTLFLGVTLMCFLYLSEFNALSTEGVIINDLERQRNKLIIENEVWNMRIAQLKSLDVIEKKEVVKKMVNINPSEIEFVNVDLRKKVP